MGMKRKNRAAIMLYQKILNGAWTNLLSVNRLERSRQASENSYFHMSSSQSTRILDRDACLLAWFLSLFYHYEAFVFSSSTLPVSRYPHDDRHRITCRVVVGKQFNATALLLDARSNGNLRSSLRINKWIFLLLHTIRTQLEPRRSTQKKIKACVKTTRRTSVLQ